MLQLLRKFITNSSGLQQQINQAEVTHKTHSDGELLSNHLDQSYTEATLGSLEIVKPGIHKVLGVCWDPDADQIIFNLHNIAHLARVIEPTKRNIVSTVGKFYDPLGFISPIVIKFKVFFQLLCEKKKAGMIHFLRS